MPSKKRTKEAKVIEEDEREEEYLLSEDDEDEEEEIVYELDANAEEKIDEILGAPAIISLSTQPSQDQYPTETHRKCGVRYTEGDIVPPFSENLIIRK